MEVFLFKALQLILALSLLVLVHEFGHYLFARIFGIRVEKFYLFFNPYFSILRYNPAKGTLEFGTWTDKEEKEHALRTWKVGKDYEATGAKVPGWRQTIYGLGWLPLGGYCKIAGMIDESMDKEQMAKPVQDWEFRSRPAYQRLLVMVGGVLFNFLLAVIIYIGIAFAYGEKGVHYTDAYAGMDFVPAAQKVGFQNGDIPLTADGRTVDSTDEDALLLLAQAKEVTVLRNGTDTVTINLPKDFLMDINDAEGFFAYRLPVVVSVVSPGSPAAAAGLMQGDHILAVGDSLTPSFTELVPALKSYAEQDIPLTVERNGEQITLNASLDDTGTLGFQLTPLTDIYPVYVINYSLLQSIPKGWEIGTTTLGNYASSMKMVFSRRGAQSLGGFGALGNMFPERKNWNWYSFWYLTAFLSVALAFMNILPIPALDGGHVMFLIWEVLTGRKVSDKVLEVAQYIGMSFLLLLMLYANANDIFRFLK